jgi:F-type H+-transporting ATPase subunit b
MNLLLPHTGTVIWMLIAFLTTFFLLKKFAWKPVLKAIKQREESIEGALLSADETKKEMAKLKADNEKIISEAKGARDLIIKEARDLKDNIINNAKQQAVDEAGKIIEAAKASIRSEKESALKEIKEQVAILSVNIAEKLLQEKLTNDTAQKELIEKLMKNVKPN